MINTNFCKISVCKDRKTNRVIIISAIDNLIKGASGQAVQNMNVAFKFKETMIKRWQDVLTVKKSFIILKKALHGEKIKDVLRVLCNIIISKKLK